MQRFTISNRLADELAKRGVIPDHCREVSIVISMDDAIVLHYEVVASDDILDTIARAIISMKADTNRGVN